MILDGAVTSCSAKGLRPQASGFSQKESEKEAGIIAHLALALALALAEACGLKPAAFLLAENHAP